MPSPLALLVLLVGPLLAPGPPGDDLNDLLNRARKVANAQDLDLLLAARSAPAVRLLGEVASREADAALAQRAVAHLGRLGKDAELGATVAAELANAARTAQANGLAAQAARTLVGLPCPPALAQETFERASDVTAQRILWKRALDGPFEGGLRALALRILYDSAADDALRADAADAALRAQTLNAGQLVQLYQTGSPALQARALRGLNDVSPRSAIAVAEEAVAATAPGVRLEAIAILAATGVPAKLMRIADACADATGPVRDAAVAALGTHPSRALLTGIERLFDRHFEERRKLEFWLDALAPLARQADEVALRVVRKQLRHPNTWLRVATANLLGEVKDEGSTAQLSRLVQSDVPEVRTAGLRALARISGPEPKLARRLIGMLADASWKVRVAAVDALALMPWPAAERDLIQRLEDDHWSVQVAAIQGLVRLRSKAAIPALIARVESGRGRVQDEAATGLRLLTNQPFNRWAPDWRRWWADHEATFVVPPLDEAQKAELERRARRLDRTGTGSFYGLEVVSDRVVFVIDHSGSMRSPAGTNSRSSEEKRTRLDIAKEQLRNYVQHAPPHHEFNIIVFSTGMRSWVKELRRADDRAKQEAVEYVNAIRDGGGTNIYGALRTAFEIPQVDTIYFLTDGAPSGGEVTDPDLILQDVLLWNRERKIVIHTVSIGTRSALLQRLADETGGICVYY